MPDPTLRKIRCDFCGAALLVRPEQLGKRLRCSKCRYAFVANLPATTEDPPEEAETSRSDDPNRSESEAEDAHEMVSVPPPTPPRTWNRAKIAARFERSAALLMDAFAQAIRGCNCDVLDVDRVNLRIRFAFGMDGQGSEHVCSFFLSGDRYSDMEIVSSGPNTENQFDPYYETIVREVGKYVMFANSASPAPPPAPAPSRREEDNSEDEERSKPKRRSRRQDLDDDDDDDDDRRGYGRPRHRPKPLALADRRYDDDRPRRSSSQHDGFSITSFVCGLIGALLFWIPILGAILGIVGIVFGVVSFSNTPKRRDKSGLAIAGLVLGAIACVLSLIIFLVYLDYHHRDRYYY